MPLDLFSFPGEPRWSTKRCAVELRWHWREERSRAWAWRRALEVLVGPHADADAMVQAVYLHRAQIEHAVEMRVRRRRTATGDLALTRNEVWRATHLN